ncbi:hypothetical protein HYZ70_02245 [Candidatus Curtissbacteria bacterium]|nr:hypothetical protein [Candidatus Curtissbacteria bacterium]
MKKFITLAGSVALLGASLIPVLAANTCINSTTGPGSTDYCTINNSSNVTVNNTNDAQILNTVNAVSNVGGNSASNNTLGGSITTGNSMLDVTVASVANINTTNVTGGPSASNNTGRNEITGPFSDDEVFINNTRQVDVNNSNTATVNNDVNATSDAGNNRADNNTGPASVKTGNSWLKLTVGTHVNDNYTTVDAGAGGSGGNTGENLTSGPFSTDYVTINNDSKAKVNNVNDLIVGNFVRALSNTGLNSASNNTLGGDVMTGNATGNVTVDTEGNLNWTKLALAMGSFANMGSSAITGPGSDNEIFLTNSSNIDVENWNNKCRSHNASRLGRDGKECDPSDLGVFNYDDDLVNAGYNNADNNTAGGSVDAGWTQLYKSLLTHLNDSFNVIEQ